METPPLVIPARRGAARIDALALAARAKELHASVASTLAQIKALMAVSGGRPEFRAVAPLIRRARQRRLVRVIGRLRRALDPGPSRVARGPSAGRALPADRVLIAVAERVREMALR